MENRVQEHSALSIFANTPKMKDLDWEEILKRRINSMRPFLGGMTLINLANVKCMNVRGTRAEIAMTNTEPKMTGGVVSRLHRLDGLFDSQLCTLRFDTAGTFLRESDTRIPDKARIGEKRFWGLTRKGETVLVTVQFTIYRNSAGYSEKAQAVDVSVEPLAQLIPTWNGQLMWSFLGHTIFRWKERAERRFHDARALVDLVESEKLVFDLRFVR